MTTVTTHSNCDGIANELAKVLPWKPHGKLLEGIAREFCEELKLPRASRFGIMFSPHFLDKLKLVIHILGGRKFEKIVHRNQCEDNGADITFNISIGETARRCAQALGCRVSEKKFFEGWLQDIFEQNRLSADPIPIHCTNVQFKRVPGGTSASVIIKLRYRHSERQFVFPKTTIHRWQVEDIDWELD